VKLFAVTVLFLQQKPKVTHFVYSVTVFHKRGKSQKLQNL